MEKRGNHHIALFLLLRFWLGSSLFYKHLFYNQILLIPVQFIVLLNLILMFLAMKQRLTLLNYYITENYTQI